MESLAWFDPEYIAAFPCQRTCLPAAMEGRDHFPFRFKSCASSIVCETFSKIMKYNCFYNQNGASIRNFPIRPTRIGRIAHRLELYVDFQSITLKLSPF